MGTNQRQNSTVVMRFGLSVKTETTSTIDINHFSCSASQILRTTFCSNNLISEIDYISEIRYSTKKVDIIANNCPIYVIHKDNTILKDIPNLEYCNTYDNKLIILNYTY